MAIRRCEASIDVVQAARIRIKNVFGNGLPVYMSFSGGKDCLCMSQIVVDLIQTGEIDAGQLTVQFIDEEAIFPCMEEKTKEWRKKFLLLGAKFEWYCLEVKHYNCFNSLTNDETFICWDRYKQDVWVRQPPPFAIRSDPKLRSRTDAYQDFLPKRCADGITIVGIRTAESIHRLRNIAKMTQAGRNITHKNQIFPIYDWTDNDVWKFLLERHIDIPEVYLFLWQAGMTKKALRVSQFFSIDTARSLVKMNEYYPDLMDRIIEREPNAYLAALYWDSEMFGRRSATRRENETDSMPRDYRAELIDMFTHMDTYFTTPAQMHIANRYKSFFMRITAFATEKDYKDLYEGLKKGDPKARTLRALYNQVYGRYIDGEKRKEAQHG